MGKFKNSTPLVLRPPKDEYLSVDSLDDEEISPDSEKEDENLESKPTKGIGNLGTMKRKPTPSNQPIISKKLKPDNLYKMPTMKELNELRETENLYHSNLFRLQIAEMLKEIRVKNKYKDFIQTWIAEFNEFLNSLVSMTEKENILEMNWLNASKVKIPVPLISAKIKHVQFQFIKPAENAFLVGSAATETFFGKKLFADVCILMPSKCFQKDNYLNLEYDNKRAIYLAYLVDQIMKKKFKYTSLKFTYFQNNVHKPIIELQPEGFKANKVIFRIFVVADGDSFKLSRFLPWSSNIRERLFRQISPEDDGLCCTPNYNANVLFDLCMKPNHDSIEKIFTDNKNIQDGLILLKVWLKQKSLDSGFSGFSSHIMTMLVAYLFKEKKIYPSMSSYQIARHTWTFLANSNWLNKGINLCRTEAEKEDKPTVDHFHTYYDVVFVDSTGFLNLCANLSVDVYLRVKAESEKAIQLLNNSKVNNFQALFMTTFPMFLQFDHILRFRKDSYLDELLEVYGTTTDKCNFAGFWYPHCLKIITEILKKGLDGRVTSIIPIEKNISCWDVNQSCTEHEKQIILGFSLNPDGAYDVLTKGPQANEDSAQEFREFWGEKAQLRRFQDGSITETCVWSSATESFSRKRLILKKIILHLLNHHFKIDKEQILYSADEFDVTYALNREYNLLEDQFIDAEFTCSEVIKCFEDVRKNLRGLEKMALEIHTIQGTSPVFRYCEPNPILPHAKAFKSGDKLVFQSNKINEGIIQLTMSGKWPDDLVAFRKIKTAFYIQIAQKLRSQFSLETRGDADGILILKNGYLFKIEIASAKEVGLMKRSITSKGVTQYRHTPESLALEKRLEVLPKLNSALHGVYQQYPSFGPAVMIAKRWLYSQMLDSYLWPDECTELLIASQYLRLGVLPNACQPQTAFFRFLHLVATTDWKNEMFLLNFNDDLSQNQILELENKFSSERNSFPPMFIATSYDTDEAIWTKEAPNVPVLTRVTLLARHTLEIIESTIVSREKIIVNDLFIPSLDGYDLIIRLRSNLVRTSLAHDFQGRPCLDQTIPAANFDPIQKGLKELRDGYSDYAVFFYDPCGGSNIAVIWKPIVREKKEFKLADVNGCTVTKTGKLKYNISQIIEDFKLVLRGLYHSIQSNEENFYVNENKNV